MEQLVQVCALLQDARHAPRLYELLAPYAAHTLVVGAASVCYGSIEHYLGILASLMRRWAGAADHFEAALRVNLVLGAHPALAHTRYTYAQMCLARGAPGDRERAIDLLAAACAAYEQLDMPAYLAQARKVLAHAQATGSSEPSPARAAASMFRRHGEYWDIQYAGSAVRLRDSRGLLFLSHLLRHPGREFHVADLAQIASPPAAGAISYRKMPPARLAEESLTVGRGGDTSGAPDQRAKAAYRVRLEALHRDLDEAERFNDVERAGRVRAEIDVLTAELARRYQLTGHASAVLPVERMRKAIGNRIRATLTKLQREHPVLSRHLHASVKLGTFCSYQPDQTAPDWACD
jgi:hypothetical protein